MKDDKLYLTHIMECIQKIETYTEKGREAFMGDTQIQDAVIRNLEIIGEATKNVSDDLRKAHPDVSWRRWAGFRDVLIHGYIRVDIEAVWNSVERELPGLKRKIEAIAGE